MAKVVAETVARHSEQAGLLLSFGVRAQLYTLHLRTLKPQHNTELNSPTN